MDVLSKFRRVYESVRSDRWSRAESIPQKLSHVVINSTDVEATKSFYETHLGFKLSDWLGGMMCFMRSGPQHHLLAIAQAPSVSLNHVSFEMRGIDEYMRGTGRLMRHGYDPMWGPGRHGPGDNTFTYFRDPEDNIVEYTTELEVIEDDDKWEPRVFDLDDPKSSDQWGTGGSITDEMVPFLLQQKTDGGLWTTSPV